MGREENMERPAPDCKGRRDLINRCKRQGGTWPPLVADYPVGTEPHAMKGTGREHKYNLCWNGHPQKRAFCCGAFSRSGGDCAVDGPQYGRGDRQAGPADPQRGAGHRLRKRYWYLVNRGKIPCKATVAIARELVGFIWALFREYEIRSRSVTV